LYCSCCTFSISLENKDLGRQESNYVQWILIVWGFVQWTPEACG
jgi:hypothetical protein